MTRLVNDVLDVTKIESGEMEFRDELVGATALLDQCGRTFGPIVEQTGLRFRMDVPRDLAPVRGDRDRLQQVVQNLLNNAMKFTVEGTIILRAAVVAHELRISISDTGIGIASEDLKGIFQRFYRVDKARSRTAGGTGLGLPIVKEVVERMGGSVEVESHLGRGSTFTILLQPV